MTYHSIKRAKERSGLSFEGSIKLIERAFERGLRSPELPGRERRFVEKKERERDTNIIYYLGFLFVLGDNEECVTMYEVPNWFCRKGNFDGKIMIRNKKKYYRYYQVEETLAL